MLKITTQKDLTYVLDYDYDSHNTGCAGCNPGGYDYSDYCRCSVIDSFDFSNSIGDGSRLADELSTSTPEVKWMEAMFLKNLRKVHDLDNFFEGNSCGGYYGEEVGSIRANSHFVKLVNDFNVLSTVNKFQAVMLMEYGSVLPELAECTKFVFKTVSLKRVHASKQGSSQTAEAFVKSLKDKISSTRPPDGNNLEHMLVINGSPKGHYRLIDGFHRHAALTSSKAKTIKVLVATK